MRKNTELIQKIHKIIGKNSAQFQGAGKAIPLQAWTGPEGSRRLRLPGGTLSALRTGRLYTAENIPGTHFC